MKNFSPNLRGDLSASLVVFLIALPLCLGIALASGAPLFAGIISGIIGGIIVGALSGSPLGVSGPAAGLSVITFGYIADLGSSFEAFLLAVAVSGLIQLVAGFLRLGAIARYFPSSVIKGMLAGIGILIILKQIPHAVGYDADFEGDFSFHQPDKQNTFSELLIMFGQINIGAVLITSISVLLLVWWEMILIKKHKFFRILPAPLAAVGLGIVSYQLFEKGFLPFHLTQEQIVQIPVFSGWNEFFGQFQSPDFSQINNPKIYSIALVIAIIGSLETLLCVEATDQLDPQKRTTPTNRELKAQGLGNLISGLVGGLPITQVIVRSSANISFGGRTKLSTIAHGFWLLIAVLSVPGLLNMIPLASLASILFVIGYKLTKPAIFKEIYRLGWREFAPFLITILAMIFTDLLFGVLAGVISAQLFKIFQFNKN